MNRYSFFSFLSDFLIRCGYYPPVCKTMSYKKCLAGEREKESMNTAVLNAHRYYYLSFRIRLAAV